MMLFSLKKSVWINPIELQIFSKNHEKVSTFIDNILDELEELNQGKELIRDILKKGKLTLKIDDPNLKCSDQGLWVPSERSIYLKYQSLFFNETFKRIFLFELCNAANPAFDMQSDKYACSHDSFLMDKEEWVENVEFCEYQSCLRAENLYNQITKKNTCNEFIMQKISEIAGSINYKNNFEDHWKDANRNWFCQASHADRYRKIYDQYHEENLLEKESITISINKDLKFKIK